MNAKSTIKDEPYYTVEELAGKLKLSGRATLRLIWEDYQIRPAIMLQAAPTRPTLQVRIMDRDTHYEDRTVNGYLSDSVGDGSTPTAWVYLNLNNTPKVSVDADTPLPYCQEAMSSNADGWLDPTDEVRNQGAYYAILTDDLTRFGPQVYGPIRIENFEHDAVPLVVKSSQGDIITAHFWIDGASELVIPHEELVRYCDDKLEHSKAGTAQETPARELRNREILIGVLLKYLLGGRKFASQAQLIEKIQNEKQSGKIPRVGGTSKNTLEKIFSQANRALEADSIPLQRSE